MKKVKAVWALVKQDAAALATSATLKADIAALKADVESMLPELANEAEAAVLKILLATI